MEKIIMLIGKSSDFYGAMSENCEGIYAAGPDIEAVKADTYKAIEGIKRNLPEDRWPEQIKGDFEIEWKFDVPSFLEYYSGFLSLAGMERMTGIHQKQLSNYLNHPERIDVDWQNMLVLKVNSWLNANLATHLIYDYDIPFYDEAGVKIEGSKVQFKEVLAIGFMINLK